MKKKFLSIILTLCLMISLLPALAPSASAAASVALGTITRESQHGYYTCEISLSSDTEMVTISVDSGYFTVPSLGGTLTFWGGTNGSDYISAYSADIQFQSAVFSFTDVSGAASLLGGIRYYNDGTAYQTITATASTVSPQENDLYFGGHFYRFINMYPDKISWPDAVTEAGGTPDPYFSGGRGYLATVTSQAENSILLRLTNNGSGGWYSAWLGALWQRNTGSVDSPTIIMGTDNNEISYSDVCSAVSSGDWSNLLCAYSTGSYGYTTGITSTYIYNRPDSILYYWIDGPEAGQEISNNMTNFAPWHVSSTTGEQNEPNNGNFVYIGYQGAYWDDLGIDTATGLQKSAYGYVIEFSGFDGGSTDGIIASSTKTVAPWSYPTSDPGAFTLGIDGTTTDAGRATNPYAITCAQDLANLAYWVNTGNPTYKSACYQLTADIVLNDNVLAAAGELNTGDSFIQWTAIGSFEEPFGGSFDGNGYTVGGIYIISDADDFQGLFGYVNGGTVKNVGVVDSYIQGGGHVGGVCGINTAGTVENCYNSGSVTGTGTGDSSYVGGVCGQNAAGASTATINAAAVIRNCYNTGAVKLLSTGTGASKAVGGICGKNFSNNTEKSAEITNCYNTGTVTGVDRVGGVCGWNRPFNEGPVRITTCYSTGTVAGTGYIGGVCGYNQDGTIAYTYYSGCGAGAGSSQDGTTSLINIQDNPLVIGSTTSIVEQTDMNDASKWNNALGPDFAISYSNYSSGIASINEKELTGTAVGIGTVTGTMTITQNELTSTGFTGATKTIIVDLSAALTVQKASPAISLSASPDSPATYPAEMTLTATLSGGYNPTGTVTFKNGETELGSAAITSGISTISYTSSKAETLSITAQYGGDTNNNTCGSSALSYTVNKATSTLQISCANINYGGAPNPQVITNTSAGTVAYEYTVQGEDSYTLEIPTDVGSYTIRATSAATTNYNSATATADFSINKTTIIVTTNNVSIVAGNILPVFGVTITGFVYGENESLAGFETPSVSCGVTDSSIVGEYPLIISGGNPTSNYQFEYRTGSKLSIVTRVDAQVPVFNPNLSGKSFYTQKQTAVPLDGTATVSDGGTMTYQWYNNTTDSTEGGTEIAGETNATLIPPTDTTGTAYYYVVATNTNDSVNGTNTASAASGIKAIVVNSPVCAPACSVDIIVNGRTQAAGTTETVARNGQTVTTVTVDTEELEGLLESEGDGATVNIRMTDGSDILSGVLTGLMVKYMEEKSATLAVETGSATYTLPAEQLGIDDIAAQFGEDVELSDIRVEVTISEPDDSTVRVIESSAEAGGFTLVVPAVEFTVTCAYNGQTTEVTAYDAYTERTIRIPAGVDPNAITTAVVVEAGGTVRHVPTQITEADGVYCAVIRSLTNSVYALIYDPVEFNDVEGHWAQEAVSDMASRRIISGYTDATFNPDGDITRAEFAAIIVRALGLAEGMDGNRFSDVSDSDWYWGYTATAEHFGLITGYDDGTFRPNEEITREQAMTIISRAMRITGLEAGLTGSETGGLPESFSDASDISDYALESITACIKAGIISGNGDNTIGPKDYVTRAEVAAMVQRLLQKSKLI